MRMTNNSLAPTLWVAGIPGGGAQPFFANQIASPAKGQRAVSGERRGLGERGETDHDRKKGKGRRGRGLGVQNLRLENLGLFENKRLLVKEGDRHIWGGKNSGRKERTGSKGADQG